MSSARLERIAKRERNAKWQNPPVRIEMVECINCDACLRHCPSHFGAIFNHGADVVIIPELRMRQVPPRLSGRLHLPVPGVGAGRLPAGVVGRAREQQRPVPVRPRPVRGRVRPASARHRP